MSSGRLILHVGAPKCGSTSLQAALSRQPDFTSRDGERFRYGAITIAGDVLLGDDLARCARASIYGMVTSDNVKAFLHGDPAVLALISTKLEEQLAHASVILSCEGWFERIAQVETLGLFDRITAPIEVIAYVRPQADYLNAAWWQWGAWTSSTLMRWLYFLGIACCSWATLLDGWTKLKGVTHAQVRLLPKDIVADFFDLLGCDRPSSVAVNRALPAVALRFLQRHRHLRPNAHQSEINAALERALDEGFARAPWVLPHDHLAYVMACLRPDNLRLAQALPPASRAIMEADARWWDAQSYADRTVETFEPMPPDAAEMDAFVTKLAEALFRAEKELAALRSRA